MGEQAVFNIHEAKTHLSRLIARVEQGEEIIIARAGVPVARLATLRTIPGRREPGRFRGRIEIADDFDAALPDDIVTDFEG